MPTLFRWLHLTDLHFPGNPKDSKLAGLRKQLCERLHELNSVDLVVISGDFVNYRDNSPTEWNNDARKLLEEFLGEIRGEVGDVPFVAAPGNHDLLGLPKSAEDKAVLKEWHLNDSVREQAFAQPDSLVRRRVREAFGAFEEWWNTLPLKRPEPNPGLLAGEFSATIEVGKPPRPIGIVVLNSAFLEFGRVSDSQHKRGTLTLDVRQLEAACPEGSNSVVWCNQHELVLLVTHHPPRALELGEQGRFDTAFLLRHRIHLHVCGDLHTTSQQRFEPGPDAACHVFVGPPFYGEPGPHGKRGFAIGEVDLDERTFRQQLFLTDQADERFIPGHAVGGFEQDGWSRRFPLGAADPGTTSGSTGTGIPTETSERVREPIAPAPPTRTRPARFGWTALVTAVALAAVVVVLLLQRRDAREAAERNEAASRRMAQEIKAAAARQLHLQNEGPLEAMWKEIRAPKETLVTTEEPPIEAIVEFRATCLASGVPRLVRILGHDAPVRCALFTGTAGDGILMADSRGTVKIWPPRSPSATGSSQRPEARYVDAGSHTDCVFHTATLSADGDSVVTTSADGTARIWNVMGGAPDRPLRHASASEVTTAEFSGDGGRTITAGTDRVANVWQGSALIASLRHGDGVTGVALDDDGSLAVTSCLDGQVRLWHVDRPDKPWRMLAHDGPVGAISFNHDRTRLVTASHDGTARIWTVDESRALHRLDHGDEVVDARFNAKGTRILTVTSDHWVWIWDAGEGRLLRAIMPWRGEAVQSARWAPKGDKIVIAASERIARVYTVRGQEPPQQLVHPMAIWDARFDPSGQFVITAGQDGTARMWELARPRDLTLEEAPHLSDARVDRSFDRVAVIATADPCQESEDPKRIKIWQRADGTWRGPGQAVEDCLAPLSVSFGGADGSSLLGVCGEHSVRLWNKAGEKAGAFPHGEPVFAAALDGTGTRVLTATPQAIQLWRVGSQVPPARLVHREPPSSVSQLAFTGDGTHFAIAYWTGAVYVYQSDDLAAAPRKLAVPGVVEKIRLPRQIEAGLLITGDQDVRIWRWSDEAADCLDLPHTDKVVDAGFVCEERLVFTGTRGGAIVAWDAGSGARVGRVMELDGEYERIEVSSNGRQILALELLGPLGTPKRLAVIDLATPDRMPSEELEDWAERWTGTTMDDSGAVRGLPRTAWP